VAALADYASERARRNGTPGPEEAFFRTAASERISYNVAHNAFSVVPWRLGWTADGRTRAPRVHDLRHRMVVRHRDLARPGSRRGRQDPRSGAPTWATSRCATSTGISPLFSN
jgi:hypothetical protein